MDEKEENRLETNFSEESTGEPEAVKNQAEVLSEASEENKIDYYDQWLRCRAEFINYKRRMEEQVEERRRQAARQIVADLLPVIDDFNVFFHHHSDESDRILQGVRLIYQKLMSIMKEKGLVEIDPIGQVFDPQFHDAVMMEETEKIPEGNIVKVWQKGYLFNDTLLRPAKVITAKAKSAKEVKDG